jgi:predicted MFS family arabinose efflux permease
MDRVGKGIRGAPRDALVADLTASEIRGAAYGLRQSLDTAPAHLRGTAFGFFNLASGIAMLIASVLAGLLWDKLGAGVTFYAGAVFSLLAFMMLVLGKTDQKSR